jgi:hypothetical protein
MTHATRPVPDAGRPANSDSATASSPTASATTSAAASAATAQHRNAVTRAAVLTAVGGVLFGYDTGVVGGVLPNIASDFSLNSPFEKGLVVAILLAGAADLPAEPVHHRARSRFHLIRGAALDR